MKEPVSVTIQDGCVYVNISSCDTPVRTVLDSDGTSVNWTSQDKLMVFDEDMKGVEFSTDDNNVTSATFKTDSWTGKSPVYASVSSAGNLAGCTKDGLLVVNISGEQSIQAPGTYAREAFASVGQVTGDAPAYSIAKMWNVPGLLKVNIDLANIKSIEVEGLDDETLAGFVRVDYGKISSGERLNFWTSESGELQHKKITVTPSENALADNLCFKPGTYYIAILPQSFPKGIKISLTDKNGGVTVRDAGTENGGITVLRNQITPLGGNVNDILPDTIVLDLDFYNDRDVNPLGFTSPTMTQDGETYGFLYNYTSMGESRTKIFDFVVCKGNASGALYNYGPRSNLTPQFKGTKVLFFAKDGGWIKTPAIRGYYLQSVTFSHGNTSPKQMQIRPDVGSAVNIGYTSKAASAVATASAPNTQTISFTSSSTKKPEKGASYYLYFSSGSSLRVYDIKLVYTRELEIPLTFDAVAVDLFAGETFTPSRTSGPQVATTASSSDASVATVDESTGKITAISPGRAVVTLKQPSTGAEAKIKVNVLDVNNLCRNLSSSEIYTSGAKLSYSYTIMQGFDINPDDGYMYFTQVGGSSNYYANHLSRRTLSETKPHDSGLKLPYFGHGQNLAVETDGGTAYCWLGCHGTHCDDDVYRYSQTIGRFPYKTGTLLPSECESYYWIPDRCNLQISLDKPNDMAMIYCISLDLSKAYMYGYRLSEMKAITASMITLPMQRRFGGPGENQPVEIREYTVTSAKNLSTITPVFSFEVPSQCRDTQGYIYKNGKIFISTGCPEDIVEDQSWNNKWTVFVLNTSGTVQKALVLDSYIPEDLVKSVLGYNLGYFEPEGFQVYDGCLYQGFASRNKEGDSDLAARIPVIMKYDLAK